MPTEPSIAPRGALRERLRTARDQVVARADHGKADAALARHLAQVLDQLSPDLLGLYVAVRSEFNAAAACLADPALGEVPLALPFARREPRGMDYRAWNRQPPKLRDDCGIPTIEGAPVVPDVVLAPCLGYTAQGFRVGYGGGYFDRWLAAHPHVTAIGIAWADTLVDEAEFDAQPHDLPMMMVITERGVVSG